MSDATSTQIADAVRPVVVELGYDLEDVAVRGPAGRRELRITVDRDGGVALDQIADLSRAVSEALDETDLFGDEPYDLEVSTPGVDRALTQPRHWRRARGRKVALRRELDSAVTEVIGRIGDSDEDAVTLIHNTKGRMSETTIPLDQISRAVLEVDFARPGEAELRRCGLDDDEIARRRQPAQ